VSRVCVIGGGPAGAVFAIRMAQLGHAVTLVERAVFPRRRLGEALTPGVRPLLASIGIQDALERAGGRAIPSMLHLWDGPARWRVDAAEGRGCVVDRGRLDALLVEHARANGVEVLQPARVTARSQGGSGWTLSISTQDGTVERKARFLADATGRGGRSAAEGPRTIAAFAYWRPSGPMRPPVIEAGDDAWFWGVPLPDGSYNTLVVCRPDTLRSGGGPFDRRVAALFAASRLLPDLSAAHRDGAAGAVDATPRRAADPIGPHFVRIGDAALALDPISSSGVQKAVQGALAAAVVANTILRKPERRATAIAFYAEHLRATADRHGLWAGTHYAAAAATRSHPFWQERAHKSGQLSEDAPRPDIGAMRATPVRLSPETAIEEAPCLEEEFVALRPVVTHPRLEGPLAYLGGHAIAPLLARFPDGVTPVEIAGAWADRLPKKAALAILARLMQCGVVVPAETIPRHLPR
jgi:flavin-dependent dehydrogenase